MRDIRELKYLQSLPLERKIEMTAQRIRGWYEHYNGNVAISFSGGKDSTVLMHIARNHWMCDFDIKAVFVDTGLEYPEIRQFDLTEEILDEHCCDDEWENLSDEEQVKKAENIAKKKMKSAIIVYIDTPKE